MACDLYYIDSLSAEIIDSNEELLYSNVSIFNR